MKQSSSDNSNSKDFAQKRTEAELEAQAILKKRNADRRGDAEVEAQSLLNERKNYQQKKDKKIQAQNDLKAKAEARKAKAEAAKVKAEMETRKIEKQLRQKRIDIEKKKHKTKVFGGLAIIIAIAIWGISYFIGNNQEKSETEEYSTELLTVDESDNNEMISSEDNSSVEEMLEKRFDYVSENTHYFEVRKNGMYGIADLKGNIMIVPKYDYIGSEDEELGIVEVKKDGKYGVVSLKTLTEIIKPKYDYIGSASEESKTIEVQTNNMYGLLSSENLTEILEPTYDYIGIYNEKTELFEVRNNGMYGLYSPKKRKVVTPCIYDFINYDGGLYRVRKDGKSGYLNDDGSVLKPLQ